MIAQAETQSVLFKHENSSIRTKLFSAHIPIPRIVPASKNTSEHGSDTGATPTLREQAQQTGFSDSRSPNNSHSSSESLVSMTFDDLIDASCLRITPPGNFAPDEDITMDSPDFFNFPADPYGPASPTFPSPGPLAKALPKLPEEATSVSPAAFTDLSTIAINFILAFVPLFHPIW